MISIDVRDPGYRGVMDVTIVETFTGASFQLGFLDEEQIVELIGDLRSGIEDLVE